MFTILQIFCKASSQEPWFYFAQKALAEPAGGAYSAPPDT